jgi:Fe-S oxidoreductase/nitrate reductase gamma subunit
MIPTRLTYWHIDAVWTFYLVAILAVAVFVAGIYRHIAVWRNAIIQSHTDRFWPRLPGALLEILSGRRIFRGDPAAGLMHALIFWGFLILFAGTVIVAANHWAVPFLKGHRYLWLEVSLDVAGLMLGAGLLWALVRRYLLRVPRLERTWSAAGVPLALLLVVATGYLSEGCRLAAQAPDWGGWSFLGWQISALWPDPDTALGLYPAFWWLHALLSLGLIAWLPWSRLFHLLAAPVSLSLKETPPPVIPTETRDPEASVYDFRQAVFFDACTRCGRCVSVCPATGAGEPFSPRDFILWARAELISKTPRPSKRRESEFSAHRIWHCTTCRACLEVCPVYAAIPDALRQSRSALIESGDGVPDALAGTLKRVLKYNNPWEATKTKRTRWAEDLEIPDLTKGADPGDFCYFVGCTTTMEPRARAIAQSFTTILARTGIPFATLGKKEPCCGDIARRAGEDGLFEINREDCTALFQKYEISRVVTSSPHCFHTFKSAYGRYAVLEDDAARTRFNVRHYTEVLADLVAEGRLAFNRKLPRTVTFHDPCYLGRHHRIFDAPRRVIRSIPGIQFREMPHHGPDSLCCGGGGDRMWQEELDGNPKMSVIRIREAVATGADLVVTACPLCLIMLEDARKVAQLEEKIEVMDLCEVAEKMLGGEAARPLGS